MPSNVIDRSLARSLFIFRYVGHEEGGQLTAAVRRKPYSVLLFDRVEKAHYLMLNWLFPMFGLGSLTDDQNRNMDFANTVIIMTSDLAGKAKDSWLQIARERLIVEVFLFI